MENLYELLEVSKNASPEVIKKAYKTLAKKHHPDVAEDKANADKMMKKLNSAYTILSNPKTREEYDYNLEQEEIKKNNINNNIQMEENKKAYDEYYNVQKKETKNNNYDNIYDNYYNQEDDYANNFNIIKRIMNIRLDKNEKIFLLIILFIVCGGIIKIIYSLGEFLGVTNNDNEVNSVMIDEQQKKEENETFIDDITLVKLVDLFVKDIKQYNFEEMNKYLTNYTKLTDENLNTLNEDKVIYQYIISNSEYIIKDYTVSNKKAEVNLEINTFNVQAAISQYSDWIRVKTYDAYLKIMEQNITDTEVIKQIINEEIESENKTEKIMGFLYQNVENKTTRNIKLVVNNTEEGWKINLNLYDVLGMSI